MPSRRRKRLPSPAQGTLTDVKRRYWVNLPVYRGLRRNVVFYDGPSLLDGEPILAVATACSRNRKIGRMVQIWIMLRDVSPLDALRVGADAAVCGDCPHRGQRGRARSCYVWSPGIEQVWRSVRDGHADRMTAHQFAEAVRGKQLRVGAYGDPGAVPAADVWDPLLATAGGWTAYTHQWLTADPSLRQWCMASVDSEAEQREAQALGWRTFRVRHPQGEVLPDEIICPHEQRGTQCSDCELCRGASRPAKSIVIGVHGSGAKWFRSRAEATLPW